jgi:hypothetical protein
MNTKTRELKTLLHESIENIDDEELLQTAKELLDRKYQHAEKLKLGDYQIDRIEKAKKGIERGEFLTNEQADEMVNKWLKG